MKREEYKMTIYESIAAYVLLEHQKHGGGKKLDERTVRDDGLLREAITEAAEWFEKTDAREINDSPFYPYVKRQFEEYLKTIRSDAFFSGLPGDFRKYLLDGAGSDGDGQSE